DRRSSAAIVPPSKTSCTNGAPFRSPTARGPDQVPAATPLTVPTRFRQPRRSRSRPGSGSHAADGPDDQAADSLGRARRPAVPRRDSREAAGPLSWSSTECRDILEGTEQHETTRTFELWEHWVNSNAASWTPSGSMTTG